MEKQFQFTSKWSNIDFGLKAWPGGLQTQEVSLCLSVSPKENTDRHDINLSAYYLFDVLYLITRVFIIKHESLL